MERGEQGDRRAASETASWGGVRLTERDRKRLTARDAEEENCGKSGGRIGLVMRRVYQLFRCRLLIKHHQTLNLLTINTLLHYRAIPFVFLFFFFLHLSLPLSLSLWVSLSLSPSLPPSPPLAVFSLSNTPNAGQINYLMHLSLSAGAPKQFTAAPHSPTHFLIRSRGLTHEKRNFLSLFFFFFVQRKGFFFFFLPPSLSLFLSL